MAITAPALAQTAPTSASADPVTAQTAPTPQAAASAADAAAQPVAPAAADQPAAPAEQAAATAAPADQVTQAVEQNFPTYDKNADGKLSEPEFAAWMVALKTESDPQTDANAPATKTWNKAAFAQADTDKSKSLTKAELTGFLTPSGKS